MTLVSRPYLLAVTVLSWMSVLLLSGQSAAGPRIVIDQPVYNFGSADTRRLVEHAFVVYNRGDAPLAVLNVHSDCGCTVARAPDRVIPPGGRSDVTVRFSLEGRKGPVRTSVTLSTSDPLQPRTVLTLEGEVVSHITVRPEAVFFGPIEPGDAAARAVDITGDDPAQPFSITSLVCESPNFACRLETVRDGLAYRLHVQTRGALPPRGAVRGQAVVETTHPRQRRIVVPLSAVVKAELVAWPDEIVVSAKKPPQSAEVFVRPGKVGSFKLIEVVPPAASMNVKISRLGPGYRVQVASLPPPDQLAGKSLLIRTDVKEMSEIVVPFRVIDQERAAATQPDGPTTAPAGR